MNHNTQNVSNKQLLYFVWNFKIYFFKHDGLFCSMDVQLHLHISFEMFPIYLQVWSLRPPLLAVWWSLCVCWMLVMEWCLHRSDELLQRTIPQMMLHTRFPLLLQPVVFPATYKSHCQCFRRQILLFMSSNKQQTDLKIKWT